MATGLGPAQVAGRVSGPLRKRAGQLFAPTFEQNDVQCITVGVRRPGQTGSRHRAAVARADDEQFHPGRLWTRSRTHAPVLHVSQEVLQAIGVVTEP